jgi:sterol desaturase/sphingolipid hydroxylase (fatty acid hydroxylase superfamily)
MRPLKLSRLNLKVRGADSQQVDYVNLRSHFVLLWVIISGLAAAGLILLIGWSMESLFLSQLGRLPWNALIAGLGCIIFLGVYIYWLAVRTKAR